MCHQNGSHCIQLLYFYAYWYYNNYCVTVLTRIYNEHVQQRITLFSASVHIIVVCNGILPHSSLGDNKYNSRGV